MMNDNTNVASIEELDALARERLATHHALETATLSFAPEATTRDIATRLHRFCLDDDEDLGGGDTDDIAFGGIDERKDALSRKTLRLALCDASRTMREWLKMREVDLFEKRVKLKLVRGLPEDVAHRAQGRKDEDGDEEAYWYPFELCRKLIGERQITIMRKGECLVPKTLLPFVWFAVYEDYLEEDLERAYREKRFAMANKRLTLD